MSSRSVFVDFVLLAAMLACLVALAILGVHRAQSIVHPASSTDDTFSPRIVTVEQLPMR